MCSGRCEMKVWMRGRFADFKRFPGAIDILARGAREAGRRSRS